MAGDTWDERRKALEDQYFSKANEEALKRLSSRKGSEEKARLSPVTGKPMEQVTMMGVVIDRCADTGGIWLDAGELEALITAAKTDEKGNGGVFASLLSGLRRK